MTATPPPPARPGQQPGQQHGRRNDVLAVLRASAHPLTIADIAAHLRIHLNTARFHLDALLQTGQVERAAPASVRPGRPALMFRARAGMDPAGPRNYQLLAGILADSLASEPDPIDKAVQAGRDWGRRALPAGDQERLDHGQAVDRLVAVLDNLGFRPEHDPSHGPTQIGLRHCPFLEVASDRPQVVCSLHLGLMQGTMDALDAPITVERLQPYAEPDLCMVHLGRVRPEEGDR
jgi:predicted ArsR family transcriptional regulator